MSFSCSQTQSEERLSSVCFSLESALSRTEFAPLERVGRVNFSLARRASKFWRQVGDALTLAGQPTSVHFNWSGRSVRCAWTSKRDGWPLLASAHLEGLSQVMLLAGEQLSGELQVSHERAPLSPLPFQVASFNLDRAESESRVKSGPRWPSARGSGKRKRASLRVLRKRALQHAHENGQAPRHAHPSFARSPRAGRAQLCGVHMPRPLDFTRARGIGRSGGDLRAQWLARCGKRQAAGGRRRKLRTSRARRAGRNESCGRQR